ncbi:MAG: helix-turn-helix transcriptional regulator [Magnetococcales bacterium]|nr:helix-turn-helix transcriptional regulator [Magnetococcales bacterium]
MISNLVGTRIRSIRAQRKLTQQQLADLAGIPRPTLATVERDDSNPSLSVVFKVANAFGMTLDQLIESSHKKVRVHRHDEMRMATSGDLVYRAKTITPAQVFHINQLEFYLKPGGIYDGKPHPPGSEEHLYILAGEIDLDVSQETIHLKKGDYACFLGNVRHVYRNVGREEGRAMVTILEGMAAQHNETGE